MHTPPPPHLVPCGGLVDVFTLSPCYICSLMERVLFFGVSIPFATWSHRTHALGLAQHITDLLDTRHSVPADVFASYLCLIFPARMAPWQGTTHVSPHTWRRARGSLSVSAPVSCLARLAAGRGRFSRRVGTAWDASDDVLPWKQQHSIGDWWNRPGALGYG